MTGAFALAGWHFSRNPTSSSSEQNVSMAANSEPWKSESGTGKYQYHPGGDQSKRRDAPSALNEVIVPNVNLPKVRLPCGKPGRIDSEMLFTDLFVYRACTRNTTSTARKDFRRVSWSAGLSTIVTRTDFGAWRLLRCIL